MSSKTKDQKIQEPIITEGSMAALLTILAQLIREIETSRSGGKYDSRFILDRLRYLAECSVRPVNQQLSLEDMAYLGRTLGLFEHLLTKPDQPLKEIDPPTDRPN